MNNSYLALASKFTQRFQDLPLSKVVILVNAELKHSGKLISASPITEHMIEAFRAAIHRLNPGVEVEVLAPSMIRNWQTLQQDNTLICPLTIGLPEDLPLQGLRVFEACASVQARRDWVTNNTNHSVCNAKHLGDHWLPIIYSYDGLCFGNIISEGVMPNSYQQPITLPDVERQHLYRLSSQLLQSINASTGVYLLQFARSSSQQINFDRLWPFPAAPAIATITNQHPDLFTYHWCCLTGQDLPTLTAKSIPAIAS